MREGDNVDQLPLTCPNWETWPAAQACALTGNQTSDLLVHRLTLNPLSHTSQGVIQFLSVNGTQHIYEWQHLMYVI